MPILIQPGDPGTFVGPGVFVHTTSSLIGPIPNDSLWEFSVYTDNENGENGKAIFETRPCVPPLLIDWTLQVPEPGKTQLQRPATPHEGEAVQVLVEIRSPTLGHQDTSDLQPFTWTQGRLGSQIELTPQAQAGGLTVEEHGWLDNVQQFIQNTAAFGGRLGLQTLAGGILEHPDIGLMHECDSPFDLVSGVDLTRPATGIGVNAFGLVLRVTNAPPGAGRRLGAVNEFQTRVAQLVSIHRSASSSSEYVTEVLDLRGDQFAWLWQNAYPERIAVDVTPGFTVEATWLCVTLPV